jgi:hypothetical protein
MPLALSLVVGHCVLLCCRPGLAPAGDFIFLSRQENEAKEGDPTVCVPGAPGAPGQPAVLGINGVWLKLALRAQTVASPDPLLPALLGAARRGVGESRAIAALGAGAIVQMRFPLNFNVNPHHG